LGLRLLFAPPWHSEYPQMSATQAIGTRLGGAARSVLAVLPPFDERICDAVRVVEPWQPLALLGMLALGALAVAAYRRRGLLLLAALALLPSLGLAAVPRLWSLHYLYLPWLFGAGALAIAIDRLRQFWPVVTTAVFALTAFTLVESWRYRDDLSLWEPEIAARPECREGHLYLGDARRQRGDLETAAHAYQGAVAEVPGFVSFSDRAAAYENLGLTRLQQGRATDAEPAFEQALVLQTDELERRKLNHDLAVAAFARADYAKVEQRLSHEASRPDALPESIELLRRARAAAQISPP
jgi:tetratricopeptide (TPR) repeat protein